VTASYPHAILHEFHHCHSIIVAEIDMRVFQILPTRNLNYDRLIELLEELFDAEWELEVDCIANLFQYLY
jgi:hypothetical protein